MAMAAARTRDETLRPRAQDIDRYVGVRMRERRIMLGLTQQQMADLIGVTYQQAHKYEKGINRIAAGRLSRIAQALGVEVGYFYDGMAETPEPPRRPRSSACCSSWHAASSRCRAASTRKPSVISPGCSPTRTRLAIRTSSSLPTTRCRDGQ